MKPKCCFTHKPFTLEEDALILEHVKQYGTRNWNEVGQRLGRSISACSSRYYLLERRRKVEIEGGEVGEVTPAPISSDPIKSPFVQVVEVKELAPSPQPTSTATSSSGLPFTSLI